MSSGAQQLIEDFEQVQKLLETYPDIKIIKTEGDPPEQYDIEYTIKGYITNPDGTASPENKHEVRITLPFGYPHFPPTAKPITPIFHPDIDPDAIRIADFWQENNSLPDLIIHIGQMICGNHYTKEEPFNQSAFDWFKERESWLPFDVLEPRDEDEVEAETEPDNADKTDAGEEAEQAFIPASDADLDILKDDIDFPFDDEQEDAFSFDIEDEEKTEEPTGFEEETAEEEVSLDLGDEDTLESFDPLKSEEDDTFNLGSDESSDEFSFDLGDLEEPSEEEAVDEEVNPDLGDEDTLESFDPLKSEEEENDIFGLGSDESSDEFSFDLGDLGDLGEDTEPEGEPAESNDLFEVEPETPGAEKENDITLDFDSEDMASAFEVEEETSIAPEESEGVDISLDDLAGLEEDEDAVDFGLAEEPSDIGDESTIDLSDLEEEAVEEEGIDTEPLSAESEGEEEKILSALSLNDDFTSETKAGDQSEVIRSLIEQKQIFTAKKVLAELPDPDSLPNKTEHEQTISHAINEAEELYKTADRNEQKGEYEKAGIILDLVANIATDFPGLDLARNRIRESMMAGPDKKPTTEAKEKESDQLIGQEKETAPEKQDKKKKKSKAGLGFKVPVRLVVIVLIILILGGLGAGAAYVYNNDSDNMQTAHDAFQKAEQLIKRKEFKNAQKELDTTRTALGKVIIFQGNEKEAILQQVESIANSALFKEGLKGRVLYGDKYVSVETAKSIDKFNTQKSFAEKVLKAGKLDQAISAYEKSLPYAEKAGFEDEIITTKNTIAELRLKLTLNNAKQSEETQDWFNAKNSYQMALELSKDITKPEDQQEIAKQLALATYHYGLNESLNAINTSQWQKSIEALEQVKSVLGEYPKIVTETEHTEVDKLLIQSLLYHYLEEAKKAYENKVWEKATDTYNDAIALLNKNIDLLGEQGTENIKKIEKTILTTQVSKEQAEVGRTKSKNELKKTVEHYETIVTLIEDSPFKDDETLAKILDDARTKTLDIKKQLLITEKEKWLTDNYDQIFRDNYPSAKSSDLMNPKVRFVKREENVLIFNLSCTERKQGSKFRLELYYQNDLDKNAWSLYSGKIEEGE